MLEEFPLVKVCAEFCGVWLGTTILEELPLVKVCAKLHGDWLRNTGRMLSLLVEELFVVALSLDSGGETAKKELIGKQAF